MKKSHTRAKNSSYDKKNFMLGRTGSIVRLSSFGWAVYLTKELKSLGLKPGQKVWIFRDNGKIVITADKLTVFRPYGISDETWRAFQSYIIQKYGERHFEEHVAAELEKMIETKVYDIIKFFGKVVTKIPKFKE